MGCLRQPDRKATEQMLITHFQDKEFSYNPVQQMTQVRQIVVIDGVLYGSVRNAALHLRKSRSTLSHRIRSDNPEFDNCYIVAGVPIRSMLCFVNGEYYQDIKLITKRGLAKNDWEVIDRLISIVPEWKDWYYLDESGITFFQEDLLPERAVRQKQETRRRFKQKT